jgi:hypothetical protein
MTQPLPASAPIQFDLGAGTLHVSPVLDPSGNPTTVLDIDKGFTFSGDVVLPGWFVGRGEIRLTADERGGPFKATVGTQTITITGDTTSTTDPQPKTYPWSINVISPAMEDRTSVYEFAVLFAYLTATGGHTDIAGFYDLGTYAVV